MHNFMKAVSVVLHPLLMPTILFILLYFQAPLIIGPLPDKTGWYLLLVVVVTTFLIPLTSVATLKFTSSIHSYEMKDRKERILPFAFISLFYVFTSYMFVSKSDLNPIFGVIFSSLAATILIATVVTLFWKISVHSIGISGGVGFLLAFLHRYPDSQLLVPLLITIFLAGLVMSSRLYLDSHNQEEVWWGSFMGFIINYGIIYWFG